ncbi:hypothetical protein DL763_001008 [Monosporascus cannonballus]|nr:hypothetical protein DL763_001008 [Monosporascus cannonballus]
MAPAPIILILGSGANIGAAIARRFDKLGYQVALVSRQGSDGGAKRQFIMTGNLLARAILPSPDFATLGIAKSASAFWIGLADKLYREKGFRFFVADQRVAGGGPAHNPDTEAHAELYCRIARDPEPWPFYITFVDGTKYEKFENGSWDE